LEDTRHERISYLLQHGYPAYTTSAGWMGYSDDKIRRLSRQARADGWTHMKMKVGGDVDEYVRRAGIISQEIGDEMHLMMDANQKWVVDEAIANMRVLSGFNRWSTAESPSG